MASAVDPHLAPDGRRIAYIAKEKLWIRDLEQLEPREVATVGGLTPLAWSPDSRTLVYNDAALWDPVVRDLARRVAFRSESQDPAQASALRAYVADELSGSLAALHSAVDGWPAADWPRRPASGEYGLRQDRAGDHQPAHLRRQPDQRFCP